MLREGIERIFDDCGFAVVVQSDAQDPLRKTVAHRPDVSIVDVQMPPHHEQDGLLAASQLRCRSPDIGVPVLSQFCELAFAVDLIDDRPERVGYLLKERDGDVATFADTIVRVAAGGSVLDSRAVGRMLGRRSGRPDVSPNPARASGTGHDGRRQSNLGVAQTLFASQAAVEKHVTAIFRKLDIAPVVTEHRRVHAVVTHVRQHERRR